MPAQMRTMVSHITRLQSLIPGEPQTGVTAVHTTSMTHDLYKAIGEANERLRAAIEGQEVRKLELFAKVVGSGTEWYQQCNLFVLHSSELNELLQMSPPKDAVGWAEYMRHALTFLKIQMAAITKVKPSSEEMTSLLGASLCKENDFNISASFCNKLSWMLAKFRLLPGGGLHAFQIMMLIVSEDWPHRVADFVEQPGSKKSVGWALRNTSFAVLQERKLWSSSQHEGLEQMQCQGGWLQDPKLAYWNYAQAYRQLWAAFVNKAYAMFPQAKSGIRLPTAGPRHGGGACEGTVDGWSMATRQADAKFACGAGGRGRRTGYYSGGDHGHRADLGPEGTIGAAPESSATSML
ncbi:hypothetical protein LTR78_004953 [Recurvomyces mirabilis]|uniref:Uncharacterized protein n=1 Tax=Recurvomyces mirabilis TaxID=574656 RepID=A0AAE0WNT7_9PEZI|nr:hypothetical protein LTR78_004953 [Recurvomyces mirabilis]KAK5158430.1 hypothetical protein LTS14_003449 [Recurvomyces mirabilis]